MRRPAKSSEGSGRKRSEFSALRASSDFRLHAAGWVPSAAKVLEKVILKGAGQALPVVFDFDNTIVSGDVGEAVLAILASQGKVSATTIDPSLGPPVPLPGKGNVDLRGCSDAMEYYEALLSPTVHGTSDSAPLANGYVWATLALEGLALPEVLAATASAFRLGQSGDRQYVQASPGAHRYPAPRFYPQVAELIALLIRLDYQVWIVSASNVWSVRWMVAHGLNPLLEQFGAPAGLSPNRVVGLATLLSGPNGALYKDSVLVAQDPQYATLAGKGIKSLRVTRHLQFPVPVYSGKVACILDFIGATPYLCAGDSPSDHAMLTASRHRLWIVRPDKPQAQELTHALMRRTGAQRWILQPAFSPLKPHF